MDYKDKGKVIFINNREIGKIVSLDTKHDTLTLVDRFAPYGRNLFTMKITEVENKLACGIYTLKNKKCKKRWY